MRGEEASVPGQQLSYRYVYEHAQKNFEDANPSRGAIGWAQKKRWCRKKPDAMVSSPLSPIKAGNSLSRENLFQIPGSAASYRELPFVDKRGENTTPFPIHRFQLEILQSQPGARCRLANVVPRQQECLGYQYWYGMPTQ